MMDSVKSSGPTTPATLDMSPTPSHPILLCVARQMLMQAKSMQSSFGWNGGEMQPSQHAIEIARGSAWNAYLLALKDPFWGRFQRGLNVFSSWKTTLASLHNNQD